MPPNKPPVPLKPRMTSLERQLEDQLLQKLLDRKYQHRPDLRERAALEDNFRQQFSTLNQVRPTATSLTMTPRVFPSTQATGILQAPPEHRQLR
jgi:hypothetical protein